MSADLVEWLTGCLDHLEAVAREAVHDGHPGRWEPYCPEGDYIAEVLGQFPRNRAPEPPEQALSGDWYSIVGGACDDDEEAAGRRPYLVHIALHDPRAVLARVEAERMVLASVRAIPMADSILNEMAWGHRFDFPGWQDEWHPTPEVSRG